LLPVPSGAAALEVGLATLEAASAALEGPRFLLGFAEGADLVLAACASPTVYAAAAVCPSAAGLRRGSHLLCPLVVHAAGEGADFDAAEAFGAAHPDVHVWFYAAAPAFADGVQGGEDSARLVLLRTRQHFHRAAGFREAGA